MKTVTLVTSSYSIEEARVHLVGDALARFEDLLTAMDEVSKLSGEQSLPAGIDLVAKDRPILAAALAGRAEFLLTGDRKHFGHLYGNTIAGTTVLPPAIFIEQEAHRIAL